MKSATYYANDNALIVGGNGVKKIKKLTTEHTEGTEKRKNRISLSFFYLCGLIFCFK